MEFETRSAARLYALDIYGVQQQNTLHEGLRSHQGGHGFLLVCKGCCEFALVCHRVDHKFVFNPDSQAETP
jgi:hypothetical protein